MTYVHAIKFFQHYGNIEVHKDAILGNKMQSFASTLNQLIASFRTESKRW